MKVNTEEDFQRYNTNRNKLRLEARKLRSSFEKKLAAELKTNPKYFWRFCKSKTRTNTKIGKIVTGDRTEAKKSEEKVIELNTFFSSVFTKEDMANLPTAPEDRSETRFHYHDHDNEIFFIVMKKI